nr:hypothetical protein [Myceligenerans sp. TRM 65318]
MIDDVVAMGDDMASAQDRAETQVAVVAEKVLVHTVDRLAEADGDRLGGEHDELVGEEPVSADRYETSSHSGVLEEVIE